MLNLQVLLCTVFAVECFGISAGVEGVWRSQGWGFVYQVRGDDWQVFEVTDSTCVAGSPAKRVTTGPPMWVPAFRSRDGNVFSIVDGGDSSHKRITTPNGLVSIVIERIEALPDTCTPPTANTALGNFDVFTQT